LRRKGQRSVRTCTAIVLRIKPFALGRSRGSLKITEQRAANYRFFAFLIIWAAFKQFKAFLLKTRVRYNFYANIHFLQQ